jgi:hypothetical protein
VKYLAKTEIRKFIKAFMKSVSKKPKTKIISISTPPYQPPEIKEPPEPKLETPRQLRQDYDALLAYWKYLLAKAEEEKAKYEAEKARSERTKEWLRRTNPQIAYEIPDQTTIMPNSAITKNQVLASYGMMVQTQVSPKQPLPEYPPQVEEKKPETFTYFIAGKPKPKPKHIHKYQEYSNPKIPSRYTIGRRDYLLDYETQKWGYEWR